MKKGYLLAILGLAAAISLSGCGSSDKETEAVTEAPAAETEAESEESLEPITPADYLIENVGDYITLGDLQGLAVTQYVYNISDESIQEEIDSELEMYADEVEVDRPAQSGDIIYVDITSSIDGDEDSESSESTYFYLGDEEYGEEFDEQLIGSSVDDELSFSITFDEDTWMDEWIGETVNFEVTVTSVCELDVPEYNDDFVAEYTDYSTTEEYEEALREELEYEYEEASYTDTVEELFDTALEECVVGGYPEELYETCFNDIVSFYSMFAGTEDIDEICDLFGMTEEDLENEALTTVYRRLLVNAICVENDLELTEDYYISYVEEYADYYGYDSAVEFETDNTREYLVWSLYESLAADFLYESAEITEADYDESDFDGEEDFEEDLEEDFEDDFEDGTEASGGNAEASDTTETEDANNF